VVGNHSHHFLPALTFSSSVSSLDSSNNVTGSYCATSLRLLSVYEVGGVNSMLGVIVRWFAVAAGVCLLSACAG